jgi:hypothetical protein
MKNELKDQRVHLMMSAADIDCIASWRRIQSDVPSRSEAIRRLVVQGLAVKNPQ